MSRRISEVLADMNYGETDQMIGERFAEVVQAVEEHGKTGEIKIIISVKREGAMAITTVKCETKSPQPPIAGSMFYFGEDGALVREDPKQMPLRGLEPPKLRTVSFPVAETPDE